MTKQYKIIAFDEKAAQVTIRVGELTPTVVDLPIDEKGSLPVGEALDRYLAGFIPTWHFERQERLSKGVSNAQDIAALVQPEPPVVPTREDVAASVRLQRDAYLTSSDWTQLADVQLSETAKLAWGEYRQALRDIPSQPGFPDKVEWPTSPEGEYR